MAHDGIFRGTVYAQNGVFGGTVQMSFMTLAQSESHVYSKVDSSSVWMPAGIASQSTELILEPDDMFDGIVLNVFCYPRTTKMDAAAKVSGKILCPSKTETDGSFYRLYYASSIIFEKGGFAQFTYSKFTHEWILINCQASEVVYVEHEDN